MAFYDLYAFQNKELIDECQLLEEILEVKFRGHDSLFFGTYYLASPVSGCKISIKQNFNLHEQEYLEPSFQQVNILIYVDNAPAALAKAYEAKLLTIDKITLLRREIL
jgi:hypothetical protein